MKPTIGRIVIAHTLEYGDTAAIISSVNDDGTCTVHMFCNDGVRITNLKQSDSPIVNSWTWPVIEKPAEPTVKK